MGEIIFAQVSEVREKLGSLAYAYDLVFICEIVARQYGGKPATAKQLDVAFNNAIRIISEGQDARYVALLDELLVACVERLIEDEEARQAFIQVLTAPLPCFPADL